MEKVMIDDKPDLPSNVLMITLKAGYVRLDLYHGLSEKGNWARKTDGAEKKSAQTNVCADFC